MKRIVAMLLACAMLIALSACTSGSGENAGTDTPPEPAQTAPPEPDAQPQAAATEPAGPALIFETTDTDGNPVKSEELFKQNRITMLNVWATWCHYCVEEMAGLAEMNRRLAEKNVAVVGLCTDADELLDTCKDILRENQVDYINLLPFDGMYELLDVSAFPTSFFIDSEGKVLTEPFVGAPADMSTYEEVIDQLLGGMDASPEAEGVVKLNGETSYRVIVSDSEEKPVQGAMVQFCSDTSCMLENTDENGQAAFDVEEGVYTVHMLKVPEGYEKPEDEYVTADTFSDVFVVLQKAT